MKQFIPRQKAFKKVEPHINNGLIKIVVGMRRVGKSFLMLQIIKEIKRQQPEPNIIYINKEDYAFDAIKSYADLIGFVDARLQPMSNYLFVDEIQDIVHFEKALRHFQLKENIDIYCTGSNANLLSDEFATLLSGRYIQIRVFSLNYKEFLQFHRLTDSSESLFAFIRHGGMPHLINLKADESVYYEYLKNVFSTIVLKDVIARYNIRNINFLRDLIIFLADNIGSLVSAKRISDYLKSQQLNIQPRTVQEYLHYLESVMFIDRVKRAEIGGRKIFEINDKFYFEDLGMRNALYAYQQKDISKLLENLVFHHLRTHYYEVFVGKAGDKEVDFIAEKDNKTIYIQVAYIISDEKTHHREFSNLLHINDNHRKLVVSMDEFASGNYKGIEHWHVRKFLVEFN